MQNSNVVVVGSGMAALVSAARMNAMGHDVVVLEKQGSPGGYFGSFTSEQGDRFDLAVSHLLGGEKGESLALLLEELELEDTIPLDDIPIVDIVLWNDTSIVLPTGLDELEESLRRQFPDSDADLAKFFSFMRNFMGTGGGSQREIGRFMMQNYQEYFETFCMNTITNPALRNALAIRIQCDDSSLMIMAGFITECYGKGVTYPRGGVGALVDTIVERLTERGVKLVLGSRAVDLVIEGGRATGVVRDDGEVCPADVVFWGGNASTLNDILIHSELGGLDLDDRRRGHSSISIFLTLDGADLSRLQPAARYYLTETPDVFETYRVLETGRLPEHPVVKVHIMRHFDSELAGAKRDPVRIEVDMYHDNDEHDETFYAEFAEEVEQFVAERLLPEIRTHCVYRRVVTPLDYQRWFTHDGGSATGWAHDVNNYMMRRMRQSTSAGNVFVTGQWGEHGSGLPQLIASADRSVALAERWLRKTTR